MFGEIDLKYIGKVCKHFRKSINVTQEKMGKEIGYTASNISSFETGRSNNAIILAWYMINGLDPKTLKGAITWQEKE